MSAARAAAAPRPVRAVWIALAAVLLTGFFAYLRFPYDRLADTLCARLERMGVHAEIARLAPSLQLGGPGWQAEGVQLTRADGTRFQLDRVRVRPAWSLSWLMLRPAVHLDLEAPMGTLDGAYTLWGPPRFRGQLRELNLAELAALGIQVAGAGLEGRALVDLDLVFAPEGPQGPVHVEATDGVFSHPELPMAIPYETLQGDLVFGGENWLSISAIELSSPLGQGSLRGTVGLAPSMADAPLALELMVEVAESIRGSLGTQGVRVGRGGEIQVKVTGTTSAPIIR